VFIRFIQERSTDAAYITERCICLRARVCFPVMSHTKLNYILTWTIYSSHPEFGDVFQDCVANIGLRGQSVTLVEQ